MARLIRVCQRRGGRTDDSGSLIFALLLSLVGMSLTALMVPMVLAQIQTTRATIHRIHALNAAQAGLDVALGHIQAANDGHGVGVLASLPCGPFGGDVSAGGTARYLVTIQYYKLDPKGLTPAQLASPMPCPFAVGQPVPAFALLSAQGTDQPVGLPGTVPGRAMQATYSFRTTNANIAGGLIHVYKTAFTTDLCMDAGSAVPAPGTQLQMQPCLDGSPAQTFAYTTDLNLVLVATRNSMSLGSCLDADPAADGTFVMFQPCEAPQAPTVAAQWKQQWSLNDAANLEGTSNGKTLNGFCFNVQMADTAGSFVVLGSGSSCHQAYDNVETFSPEAAVGAGAAGAGSGQLVNFKQFGRCLDVTEQRVDFAYMIAWPCKQAPDPANVLWNQKWTLPAPTGQLTTTTKTGAVYCLRSPRSTTAFQYVDLTDCPGLGSPPALTWTVFGAAASYADSYVVQDGDGNCLSPTDPSAPLPDLYPHGNAIGKMVVAVCDGSTLQKWNADPNILDPLPLKDVAEN